MVKTGKKECVIFKSFLGAASDPAGGLQRPPDPQLDWTHFALGNHPKRGTSNATEYSFHPVAGITWKNANIKDEFKGANTRIN